MFLPRRLRFSLRGLLVLVTISALVCGMKVNQARKQKHIVAVLEDEGAEVRYAYQFGANNRLKFIPNARRPWLARFVGDDLCAPVVEVRARPAADGEDIARWAGKLSKLRVLSMEEAYLLKDKDLHHLSEHRQLLRLYLGHTDITDGSVPYLCSLQQLRVLDVQHTHITREGAHALRTALPNCTILYERPRFMRGGMM